MTTPNERLKKIREQRGYGTAREAAHAFGWSISAYASHENGHRGIPPDAAIKYSRALGFSLDWLYSGATSVTAPGVAPTPNLAFQLVPRLSWNYVEKYGNVETAMAKATEFASIPKTASLLAPVFSLLVVGDSMKNSALADSFREGDEVVFSQGAQIKPGDFVLVEMFSDKDVIFRQYMEREKGGDGFISYDLTPLNPAHRTYRITSPEQARIVGKMVRCIRNYD